MFKKSVSEKLSNTLLNNKRKVFKSLILDSNIL